MVGASRFERPVRSAHFLAGVTRVAPYSLRRHPPALPQSVGRQTKWIVRIERSEEMVGASRFERPTSCSQGRRANQAALRPDTADYR